MEETKQEKTIPKFKSAIYKFSIHDPSKEPTIIHTTQKDPPKTKVNTS
jgi:hypothetical protein